MTKSQDFPQPVAGTVVPRFGDVATFMRLPLFRDPAEVEIGMVGVPWDATDPDRTGPAFDEAARALGQIDLLVYVAGLLLTGGDAGRRGDDAARMMEVNVTGAIRLLEHGAEYMKAAGRGRLAAVGSIAGDRGRKGNPAYGASKAGLINLTQNLARALAPEVRVNAVAPGHVVTAWTDQWPTARREHAINKSLLKKVSRPDDIAAVIVFLCAGTTMITGQTVPVEGGYLLG